MSMFNYKRVAEGYANDRPSYHSMVMKRIREELQICENFSCGLDVGCGSGSSTIALKEICNEVIGIEESEEMLKVAKNKYKDENIYFLKCRAEDAPFRNNFFDVVTASGSVNWIEPHSFLPLVNGQIKKGGWFIIYDYSFVGRVNESECFDEWYNSEYLAMFPKPFRNEEKWDDALVHPYGFHSARQEKCFYTVTMNQREFVNFIVTQTNVISAVEQGRKVIEDVYEWLDKSLNTIFSGERKELLFEGYIWYLKNEKAR